MAPHLPLFSMLYSEKKIMSISIGLLAKTIGSMDAVCHWRFQLGKYQKQKEYDRNNMASSFCMHQNGRVGPS